MARAEFRNGHADAFLRVVGHVAVRAVDFQGPLRALGEFAEFSLVVQIVNLHLHAVQLVAVELVHLRTQLVQQAGHDPFAGRRDAAADDDQAVHQRHGRSHGVAGDLAHFGKSLLRGLDISRAFTLGDFADIFRFEGVVHVARSFAVDAFHGTDRRPVLDDDFGHFLVTQAERLDA